MTTKNRLELPAFRYSNFEVPSTNVSESLIENRRTASYIWGLTSEADLSGKCVYELAAASAPLQWRVALYHVGRGLAWADEEAQRLPDTIKEMGRRIYENAQLCRQGKRNGEGTCHRDAVYLFPKNQAPKGWRQPKEDYRFGIYFKGIDGFEKTNDLWQPKTTPETDEIKLWVAPEGFIVPTLYGAYHPETGIFLETEGDMGKAIRMWMNTDVSESQAKNELSRGYRKDDGLAAVESWSTDNDGPLCAGLGYGPDYRYYDGGSFPASRS